jgi:hypothetical protein
MTESYDNPSDGLIQLTGNDVVGFALDHTTPEYLALTA